MTAEASRAQVGKVILSLDVFEKLIRLDGANVTGVVFDPIEQTVTIGLISPDFPEVPYGWPVEACFFEERNGRLTVIHPRVVPLSQCRRAEDA